MPTCGSSPLPSALRLALVANLVYAPGVPLLPVRRSQALFLNPHIPTMLPTDEVAALSRIRITINRYRHPTGDPQDLVNTQHLAAYLKRHLARSDWAVGRICRLIARQFSNRAKRTAGKSRVYPAHQAIQTSRLRVLSILAASSD